VGWKAAGVSVRGFSHEVSGDPCQDSHLLAVLPGGWLVVVTADGAGSARYSDLGSQTACQVVLDALSARLRKRPLVKPADVSLADVRRWVEGAVEAARERITALAAEKGGQIADCHATLVGCIAGEDGGYFFHIGDGAGFAIDASDPAHCIISGPENGDYADTTYFLTEDGWKDRLRVDSFDRRCDLILLMSDGVTPMAMKSGAMKSGEGGPHAVMSFVEPINRFLAGVERERGEAALTGSLSADGVRDITGDDKTLVWALRTAHA
jgi:hypothetical protein